MSWCRGVRPTGGGSADSVQAARLSREGSAAPPLEVPSTIFVPFCTCSGLSDSAEKLGDRSCQAQHSGGESSRSVTPQLSVPKGELVMLST